MKQTPPDAMDAPARLLELYGSLSEFIHPELTRTKGDAGDEAGGMDCLNQEASFPNALTAGVGWLGPPSAEGRCAICLAALDALCFATKRS